MSIIALIILAVLWLACGGFVVTDNTVFLSKQRKHGKFDVKVDISSYSKGSLKPFLLSHLRTGAPYTLSVRVVTPLETQLHRLELSSLTVRFPNGNVEEFVGRELAGGKRETIIFQQIKKDETYVGDFPSHVTTAFTFKTPIGLDDRKHDSCNVRLEGLMISKDGTEAPVDFQQEFRRLQNFNLTPFVLYVSRI